MSEPAIRAEKLEKRYAGGVRALKGIDLVIPQGAMFGLLGPNGAGKSTFINILAGLVTKTAGRVEIWGFDIDSNPRNARVSIGVVPQEIIFDAFFTPREMLEVQAGLYGVPARERRTDELLKAVHLWDKRDAYSRTLSGGMKRRLLVAKAMVHSPPVLILDEPTAGVDIELRQQLWDLVRALNRQGVTIVLTTHYLEEAEELCDTIAIINHGELICCEPTPRLLARIDEKEIVLDLNEPVATIPEAFRRFRVHQPRANRLVIQLSRAQADLNAVIATIQAAGLSIADLSTSETDLEDIFLQLTRDSNADAAKSGTGGE